MARRAVRELTNIPVVADGEPGDPAWHPLQHYFGLSTFGANVFGAREAGQTLIETHVESASGQGELSLVLDGEATFEYAVCGDEDGWEDRVSFCYRRASFRL